MARINTQPVRRVEFRPVPDDVVDISSWPYSLPPVRQIVDDGLDLAPITVLVGENGSGKSTLVEAIAVAYGMSPEGGSIHARHSSRPSESALHDSLALVRGVAPRWGFFLRAETMHGFFSYLEHNPGRGAEPRFHEMSHGQSFLAVLQTRFNSSGFYCLDEPESALSFSGSMALVGALLDIERAGGQALVATHSPIVAAIPGARILEVGPWGLRETSWSDLELVQHWRAFLDTPERYLRHVTDSG